MDVYIFKFRHILGITYIDPIKPDFVFAYGE